MNFSGFGGRGLLVRSLCAIALLNLACGCTSTGSGGVNQSYKGVLNLEAVKLGTPEEACKTAILSFVADPSVPAPYAQYLSRTYDSSGGQYCLAFKDGNPRLLRVVYSQKPIPKEEALTKLKSIVPASAPEESKVDDSEVKEGKKPQPVEYRYFGSGIKAEIIYADKSASTVKVIAVSNVESKKEAAGTPADETKKK